MEVFFNQLGEKIAFGEKDVDQLSPLVLAYVGDAVYELFVRLLVISEGSASVHVLHKRSTGYVKASAQSDAIRRLFESLTAQEQYIVRRGRNAKSGTVPKNADLTEYKYATGLECLVGYLYLKKEYERLLEVLKKTVDAR